MRVVIVLPTYNERDNIGPLLHALLGLGIATSRDLHILVCDDASPDGTADLVRAVQRAHPSVHLSIGAKAGLGAAYIRGIRMALDELGAEVVMQMDADFSHDPQDVPRLLATLDGGADVVIGSRYVPGGGITGAWSAMRRANSRWGNRVARHLVGLYPIRDCTSGFRAIRAPLLRRIELGDIRVQGYGFLVALLYEAKLRGARITEIPIVFADRTRGTSKLGPRDIFDFITNALWLRFRSSATFGRVLIVGGSGVIVNLGAFTLLLAAGVNEYVASPLAIGLSILSNLTFHKQWTFKDRGAGGTTTVRARGFSLLSLCSLMASYAAFIVLSILYPQVAPPVHQLLAIVPATLVNYFLDAYWTYRNRSRQEA